MAPTIIVTGADRGFFLMGCVLKRSLARWAPTLPFYFLDFGLDAGQRRFFQERGMLIERPASVPADLHPFVCKMALGEYLKQREWSAAVWLDSDMLVVGPLQDRLAEVITEMAAAQSEVAACSVETIRELLAGGWPMAPFVEALQAEGISFDTTYYNNGAVVFRSAEFLDAWWTLARQIPAHTCVDQNLFNLLALRRKRITRLPVRVWNLHGALLPEASAVMEDGQRRIVAGAENETVVVLHPTSIRDLHHVPLNCRVGSSCNQLFKLFRNPALRECQMQAIAELIAEDGEALARAGVDNPGALIEAANAQFGQPASIRDPKDPATWGKVGRLEPCPCGSGKRYKHCHGQYA